MQTMLIAEQDAVKTSTKRKQKDGRAMKVKRSRQLDEDPYKHHGNPFWGRVMEATNVTSL
jgi:hypothetical protein